MIKYVKALVSGVAALAAFLILVAVSPLHNPGVTTGDDPVVWTGTHTNTSQPCFLAFNSVTDIDVTGAGTTATVDFDTEVFDQGNDFAADTFTAPVTGRYLLMATVRVDGITTAGDELDIAISTSNRLYRDVWASSNNMPVPVLARSIGVIADMDAADTATVTIQGFGEASDVMDVFGTTAPETFFSGCLLS